MIVADVLVPNKRQAISSRQENSTVTLVWLESSKMTVFDRGREGSGLFFC